MKLFLAVIVMVIVGQLQAQESYEDSIKQYHRDYVKAHEVVMEADKHYMHFFAPDRNYKIKARFEAIHDAPWIPFLTSGRSKKNYRVYGVLHFYINDTAVQLNLYQSQSLLLSETYRDHLFLPFTDATTGFETYETGRYMDIKMDEIRNNELVLDFNKAYNPYCAYVSGVFNCPIPPAENQLKVAIRAGEMKYSKH